MSIKYVKYMPYHSVRNASRNRREIYTAIEYGYSVYVFSNDKNNEEALLQTDIKIINDGTINVSSSTPKLLRIFPILKNKVKVFTKTQKLDADVMSCHDITALFPAYIATRFKKKKPLLIYDSHEFEIGRNKKRNAFQLWWITHLERFLIKRCAFSIMVNDSIADEVQKIHKLPEKPVVVRSTPEKWEISCEDIKKRKLEYKKELPGTKWFLMYHGLLAPGRGVEGIIDVAEGVPETGVVILGNPTSSGFYNSLKEYVNKKGLNDRVYFHSAVPISELKAYVAAADIGLILSDAPTKSYYYGLPNKFFENIQAKTPVIVTALPEMERIVKEYDIGLVCPIGDIKKARELVSELIGNPNLYQQFKMNLNIAQNELCWEQEKGRLVEAWNKYIT